MKGDYGYILGFTTLATGYFLGYLWSPDYTKFFINGYNHLWIVAFGLIALIGMFLIDLYFKKKINKE